MKHCNFTIQLTVDALKGNINLYFLCVCVLMWPLKKNKKQISWDSLEAVQVVTENWLL